MRNAANDCRRLIPLYSTDYWASGACVEEFDAYWQQHLQNGAARFLLPLEIQPCTVPDMHKMLLWRPLHTLNRDEARAAILKVLQGITPITTASGIYSEPEPPFPGAATTAAAAATSLTWPARRTSFLPDMANRHDEFEFFASTLCDSVPQRATLVSAGSDHGKTRLVAEFHRYGCEVLGPDACAFIDFKGRGTVDHIWDTLALDLGSRLPGLSDRSPGKLREGLRRATAPVLLSFDAFEQGTEEARDFVQKHFLADLGRTNAMRLLIAGQPQAMPDPKKAAWEAHARRYDLGNIPDPQPWVDWASRVYDKRIPTGVVAAIVLSCSGAPGPIANQLRTLGGFSAIQLQAYGVK